MTRGMWAAALVVLTATGCGATDQQALTTGAAPPSQSPAAPRVAPSQQSGPADAIYVWGPTRFAEPVPSTYSPKVSRDAAERELPRLFPEVDERSGAPTVHLWALSDTRLRLSRMPVWAFVWPDQRVQLPVGGTQGGQSASSGMQDRCTVTMFINADTGAGVQDTTICRH